MVELLNGTALFFDDYASVSHYPKDIKKWLQDGADLDEWKTPAFIDDIKKLKSGTSITAPDKSRVIEPSQFIVIEEPMGRNRKKLKDLIDFVVVIDTPFEIALTRRLLRSINYTFPDGFSHNNEKQQNASIMLLKHFEDYLTGYVEYYRDLYVVVHKLTVQNCDLIVDGTLPTEIAAHKVIHEVKEKLT